MESQTLPKRSEFQDEIKMEEREAKINYTMNLQKELSRNNLRSVWTGMMVVTGFKGCETKKISYLGMTLVVN